MPGVNLKINLLRIRSVLLFKLLNVDSVMSVKTYEPRHEKTCLQGLRPGKTQTGLLSYRDQLETWNFGFSKNRYYTI